MISVNGGLLVVLPLTKPAQPVIVTSDASDANKRNSSPKKGEQEDPGLVRCPPHRFNDLADAIAIFPPGFRAPAAGWFRGGEQKLGREQKHRF
jgi:hypothetical protein